MCWQCENPRLDHGDYLELVCNRIDACGWLVQFVEAESPYPPWAYTVGLSEFGLPELVATGLGPQEAAELLNGVAAHAVHAEPPDPGEVIPLVGGPVIEVVRVGRPEVHLVTAVELYGPEIEALQLVHADEQGNWPWSQRFRGGRGGQPVLGERGHD